MQSLPTDEGGGGIQTNPGWLMYTWSSLQLLWLRRHSPIAPPSLSRPDVLPELDTLIMQLLATDPEKPMYQPPAIRRCSRQRAMDAFGAIRATLLPRWSDGISHNDWTGPEGQILPVAMSDRPKEFEGLQFPLRCK
jgi:hypothetical protein